MVARLKLAAAYEGLADAILAPPNRAVVRLAAPICEQLPPSYRPRFQEESLGIQAGSLEQYKRWWHEERGRTGELTTEVTRLKAELARHSLAMVEPAASGGELSQAGGGELALTSGGEATTTRSFFRRLSSKRWAL